MDTQPHAVPWPCSRPPPTHTLARDSCMLMLKSGLVSCGVTVFFSWVLVYIRFSFHPPSLFSSKTLFSESCINAGGSVVGLMATTYRRAFEITADGDCSQEIKRHLLLGRKAMTKLSSCQLLSHVWLFATLWTASGRPPCPSPTPGVYSLMCIESVMLSNHLILCFSLLLLPSIFPSIKAFSNESALCIRWPKYWSFSFNVSPSNAHSGLISLRMDWLDLLAVQGTLKSLLQYHSSKESILWFSAFFIVQLSQPYMTTGKTIALIRWNFLDKAMSLLFIFLFILFYFIFYCSGFCHTLKWNSHGFTCVSHPDPPSHLPLQPIPLGLPSVPGPSACLMHPTWAGDLFHHR